jgi:D-3-phosphoglycerate dehydrogenase / 2-oxoglutarate reductase
MSGTTLKYSGGQKPKILVSESAGFSSEATVLLREVGDVTFADLDRNQLKAAVTDTDILWVRLRHCIDSEVMDLARHLSIIVSPTTGLNHIDLAETIRREIKVLSLRDEKEFLDDVRATAEHTVALILSLLRHIPAAVAHVQQGHWDRDWFRGRELYGKTVGVVGYGRLGRIVSRYLSPFDVRILVTDPNLSAATEPYVIPVSLHELLIQADMATLHVNLNEETRGFFGKREFSLMKPRAWFINTARGELVDESALLDALQSGRLAGAALDVLSQERSDGMSNHTLVAYARQHDNLIITPHIGGCTEESMEKTEVFLANRLADLLRPQAAL